MRAVKFSFLDCSLSFGAVLFENPTYLVQIKPITCYQANLISTTEQCCSYYYTFIRWVAVSKLSATHKIFIEINLLYYERMYLFKNVNMKTIKLQLLSSCCHFVNFWHLTVCDSDCQSHWHAVNAQIKISPGACQCHQPPKKNNIENIF